MALRFEIMLLLSGGMLTPRAVCIEQIMLLLKWWYVDPPRPCYVHRTDYVIVEVVVC